MKHIVIYILLLLLSSYLSADVRIGSIYDMKQLAEINQGKEVSDITGFEMNLIHLISKKLNSSGMNVEFIQINQDSRESNLANKHVDMVLSSFSINEKRLKEIDFTYPYLENKGLSLIANIDSDIDINNLSKYKIGYINSSTAYDFIVNNGLNGINVENVEKAIEEITNNNATTIDSYLGDFVDLQYHQRTNNKIKIFHTFPNKQKDFYAIGVRQDNQKLKERINDILFDNMDKIDVLKHQWIDDNLHSFNQLTKIDPIIKDLKQTIYLLYIFGAAFIVIIIFLLLVAKKNKIAMSILHVNMNTQIKTLEKQKNEMGNLLSSISADTTKVIELIKVDILKSDEIAEAGIDIFNSAKKDIYYIGAGGFSSNNKNWRNSLNKFIADEETILIRIVDLPINGEDYFSRKDYVAYLMWLIQRAAALEKYPNRIELHNTREAPLWNRGYIRIFQDDEKALVFTGDHQTGNLISDNIKDFYDTARNMKTEESLTKEKILDNYFKYQELNEVKKDILDNLILYIKNNFDNPDESTIRENILNYLK